jgi:hypothetical protein
MNPKTCLWLLLTSACVALALGETAAGQEDRFTIVYSVDERGEITPCG